MRIPSKTFFSFVGVSLIVCQAAFSEEPLFSRADSPRTLEFPADHASHPDFATEWWYLTGYLKSGDDQLFGFQATWFRSALVSKTGSRPSNLAVRDVILFHGGLTDVGAGTFVFDSKSSRAASTWAGAATDRLQVWVLDRRLEDKGDHWSARFQVDGSNFDLELAPSRSPLLHGLQPGLSKKGPHPGEASYYYSQSRLTVSGTLQIAPQSEPIPVEGQAWFDHEFFTDQLTAGVAGWDWFSVALDDGTDLMLFDLRGTEGERRLNSAGTLRGPDGERRPLLSADFIIEVTEQWSSPKSPGEPELSGREPYPAGWKLKIPSADLILEVVPLLPDQEHRSESPAGVSYWEGLCRFTGYRSETPVEGLGYAELVGYQGAPPQGL